MFYLFWSRSSMWVITLAQRMSCSPSAISLMAFKNINWRSLPTSNFIRNYKIDLIYILLFLLFLLADSLNWTLLLTWNTWKVAYLLTSFPFIYQLNIRRSSLLAALIGDIKGFFLSFFFWIITMALNEFL